MPRFRRDGLQVAAEKLGRRGKRRDGHGERFPSGLRPNFIRARTAAAPPIATAPIFGNARNAQALPCDEMGPSIPF
jgi:hypothetical protein